ncbi:RING finger protein [Armadillidium nasatum]|uniref:RING finger protein n=1 Tax=Armadillidium nasatum TaxID=96803 RepID=A0A5N5TIA5_9CRUS|nr:RING finger protein [Armadillidium nasatum]
MITSSSEDETKINKKSRKMDLGNRLIQRSSNKIREKNFGKDTSESEEENVVVSFKSKKTAEREGPSDMGATATLEIETEKDKDAQAIFERTLKINKETRGQADDKVYRGLNNYSQFYEKRDTAKGNAASGSVRKGPIRAPENIRSTVRWDYQPDLCKDFKETGFCGFGDSCKFLHDRTDYKFGWQLEMEHQKTTKGFEENDSDENYEIPSDDEHLPFKCLFCRQSFVDPVVTRCKHYFCEKCALSHFAKSKRCYVCSENTNGMFTPAREIIARLEQSNKAEDDSDNSGDID